MVRRAPTYAVTTFALVFIAVAAFSVRYAARFLPERQPTPLQFEYGEYVRRSMRETVEWHSFGSEAFRQASDRGKIVFYDVGTVISLSAKRFSEDYATDGEYRQLLHDHFEPIKIDALEAPWVVDALGIETGPFLGVERFLAVTTDPRGGILAWSPLHPQGGGSLAAWLENLARLRYADPAEVTRRATESLQNRATAATSTLSSGPCDPDAVRAWAEVWVSGAASGVLLSRQVPISATPIDLLASVDSEQAMISALNLLLELALSPSFDVVDGGFFVFADDARWRSPVTAKLTGHSMQMAATYAEVGVEQDVPMFREIARRTASWALARREGNLFYTGIGTDQVPDGSSPYYSLTSDHVQGKPFLVEEGLLRIGAVSGFSSNTNVRRTELVFEAADTLLHTRNSRTPPRPDPTTYANQNGQAISGMFRVGTALAEPEFISVAEQAYAAARNEFVRPLGDILHAPRGVGRTTGYSGDYVWMARAAIDGYLATGKPGYLDDARRISDRMLELFRGKPGALMAYLPSLLEVAGYGIEVYRANDAALASANAIAAMNLADLATITGRDDYRSAAEGIIRAFSGKFSQAAPPAGLVLAGMRLYEARINRPSTP